MNTHLLSTEAKSKAQEGRR